MIFLTLPIVFQYFRTQVALQPSDFNTGNDGDEKPPIWFLKGHYTVT